MGVPIAFYQYDENIKTRVTRDCIGIHPKARRPPATAKAAQSETDQPVLARHDLPGFAILGR